MNERGTMRRASLAGDALPRIPDVCQPSVCKSPSLYEYVPNLHGLFDLTFQFGSRQLMDEVSALRRDGADEATWFRRVLHFCVADPARFQLMLQRPVPGYTPSTEAMAVSQSVYDSMRGALAEFGITRQQDVDLIDSLLLGLAGNQVANERAVPGTWISRTKRSISCYDT
jgi:hypothetical protein